MVPNILCSIDLREQVKVNPIYQSEATEPRLLFTYESGNDFFPTTRCGSSCLQATIKKRKGNGVVHTLI